MPCEHISPLVSCGSAATLLDQWRRRSAAQPGCALTGIPTQALLLVQQLGGTPLLMSMMLVFSIL